jgi:hypothetical protein
VFLSSTVRDLETYRRGIKEALGRAEVECYPSEDWVNAHEDTVAMCRRRFDGCNSYVLLLGHWYGTELPGAHRTVTQEEFRWACERPEWQCASPPKAVLVPTEDSLADAELRAIARRLKSRLRDKDLRSRHDMLVDAWHREVLGTWKAATRFSDLAHLREAVLVLLRLWDPAALIARARSAEAANDPGVARLGHIDLGLLCRAEQFRAIRAIRSAAELDEVPAVAMLVHGDRDSGGEAFVQRLAAKELRCGAQAVGSLPTQGNGAALLVTTVAQLLGLTLGPEATPAALAALVARELKTQSLAFVLGRCAVYSGGIAAIEAEFWQPLHAALHAIHRTQPLAHRLTAVFADFSGKAQAWLAARGGVSAAQHDRLQAVLALGTFDRVGVLQGFEDLQIARRQRKALVELALKDEAGEDDPVPVRVLARLIDQPIDYEEEDPR